MKALALLLLSAAPLAAAEPLNFAALDVRLSSLEARVAALEAPARLLDPTPAGTPTRFAPDCPAGRCTPCRCVSPEICKAGECPTYSPAPLPPPAYPMPPAYQPAQYAAPAFTTVGGVAYQCSGGSCSPVQGAVSTFAPPRRIFRR